MRVPAFAAAVLLTIPVPFYAANNTSAKPCRTVTMDDKSTVTLDRGCIVRGPRDKKRIALEFTGGEFADGGTIILDTLKKRRIKASFFFIGDFLRRPEFQPLLRRIIDEGHYLGPHSDKHPLYASWENPPKLQITREEFEKDLNANMVQLAQLGVPKQKARFFIPPYEHYTPEISQWTADLDMTLINYTTGTRTHADYMEDDHPRFVTSPEMLKGVFEYETKDPDGLNGFMLLMHIGAGPRRTRDHLYNHLDELLEELSKRAYQFVRIDELLETR